MRATSTTWAGVTATVYWLAAGEKVARHRHPVEHTTQVLFGDALVEIFDTPQSGIAMDAFSPVLRLPANIDHEITATMDGTIVLNMIAGGYAAATDTGLEQIASAHGGVMLEDGTVVPHGS